jgi:ATP-dependent DNA helicase DinG
MARVLELTGEAAADMRSEIARAKGNEVCFLAEVEESGAVHSPRAVARGHGRAVLAAARDATPGTLLIHNHPTGDLTPSEADLQVASTLYAQGLGLAIIDNAARELYVVVEPASPSELKLLDEEAVSGILAPGGPISRSHAGYEDRPMQREMARAVARVYNEGGAAVLEAGTGTGKSIAYLVPAIAWSTLNNERTVVSTNTINLQEQLVGKDLPFLRRSLGAAFRFALVKGRHNYISIRRARLAALGQAELFDNGQRSELTAITEWVRDTREGSLQDLPFTPSPEVWDEVVSDPDVCLRVKCPHFEECFYQRSRRDAASADILVVNHHLLFSDLAVRRSAENYTAPAVLPPYRRVILDEAHNLEDAATSHLGASVTRRGVMRLIARLDRRGRGALSALEARLRERQDDLIRQAALRLIGEELRPRVERARELALDLFARLEEIAAAAEDGVLRLHDDFPGEQSWIDGPAPVLDGLLLVLDELGRGVHRLRGGIAHDRRWADAMEQQLIELHGIEVRLLQTAASLRIAFRPGTDAFPMVRWLERRAGGGGRETQMAAKAAPIDLSEALRDSLFERVHTTVLTSATLSTRDGFEFIRRRLGLGAGLRVTEASYPSPFDFAEQTLVAIPTDFPEPRGEHSHRVDSAIAAATEDHARLCDGGIFVLFTSYRSLRAVATELRRRGAEGRWPLFVQGEGPRARLLERFVASGHGILLGVTSFWEGVDVPGEPLRGLIIPKLPFKVPTEPLTAARIEFIESQGGNSFVDYMLPHAALRLKQGFGRLVRTRLDRGAIVILDRRVLARGYGRYLLQSLPPAPVHTGTWADLRELMRRFYVREPTSTLSMPLQITAPLTGG